MDAQVDLSLCLAHTHFDDFIMLWLIFPLDLNPMHPKLSLILIGDALVYNR